jgi:tRNA(Ile2) C34 agmatinyltransferase TiaS
MVKSEKIAVKKYRRGLLYTPPIPCPACSKKTKAYSKCQLCDTEWNEVQLKERERLRNEQIEISRKEGLLE